MQTTFARDDKLHLTNLTKVFWPEHGYTKGDLLNYYREIAPAILPYLIDRPQILHRHVDGYAGKEFFQRVSRQRPAWVPVADIIVIGRKPKTFHLCQNWPTLLWLANFGCIEFDPWNSRMQSLDRPDYLIIDLDPSDGVPFSRVVEVALVVRKVLDRAGAPSFPKTSGQKGMHVYIPLEAKYLHEQAKLFGEIVGRLVHRELPALTCLDPRLEKRFACVYLDKTRNARAQAVAAAYSARPYPGATVSAPLAWSEVRKTLDPSRFTIKTMPARIAKVGDLWAGVLGEGIDLADCLQRLEKSLA
ncbi:MAG: hypothetical protein FJ271_21015 [Planctomycetes bacterium]|nr:hypothetical protein [Planctomycetota bacterium]